MDACPICRGDYSSYSVQLDCQHTYHSDCIDKWISKGNSQCPICCSEIKIFGQFYPKTLYTPDERVRTKALTPWVWKVLVKHSNDLHTSLKQCISIRLDYLLEEVVKLVKKERPHLLHRSSITIDEILTICMLEYQCQVRYDSLEYIMT